MRTFWKSALGLAFSGVILGGVATSGMAQGFGENFTIDESCGSPDSLDGGLCSDLDYTGVGDTSIISDIDRINFTYSAVVEQSNDGSNGGVLDGDMFWEDGFIDYTGYISDNGQDLESTFSGIGVSMAGYDLYATFTVEGTAAVSGADINATFTSFTIMIYLDDDEDTILTLPDDPSSESIVKVDDDDDLLIATATLLLSGEAELENSLAGGDFAVVLTDFGLSIFGPNFLIDPSPFYSVMELDGNTSKAGIGGDGSNDNNACVITEANATDEGRRLESLVNDGDNSDFSDPTVIAPFTTCLGGSGQMFFKTIPEPTTLGMLGFGLLVLGATGLRRRRRESV